MIFVKELIFPSPGIKHCSHGLFQILHWAKEDEGFLFCGVHSHFQVFIPFFVSRIQIDSAIDVIFAIKANISLTNRAILSQPYLTRRTQPLFRFIFVIQNEKQHWYLKTYHILVKKILIVKIVLPFHNNSLYRIRDGPSHLSTSLAPHGHIAKCSTFQCQVLLLLMNLPAGEKLDAVNFVSENLAFKKIVMTKHFREEFLFKSVPDTDHEFAAVLQAHPGYHLNITIIQMIFEGHDQMRCLFGGLTIYEESNLNKPEIALLCSSVGSNRNFYSHGSELALFIYQYKGYHKVLTLFQISLTKCRSTSVDLVLTHRYCCHASASVQRCNIFLANISPPYITFSLSKKIINVFDYLTYIITNTTCFVLQVRKDEEYNYVHTIQLTHNTINYQGSITVVQALSAHIDNHKESLYLGDCLKILAKVNQLEDHFEGRTIFGDKGWANGEPGEFYHKEVCYNSDQRGGRISMILKLTQAFKLLHWWL